MGLKTVITGYTAWSNTRLVRRDCEASDILKGIMQGYRMKALLQELTGHVPKGLDSMDKLTPAQKSTRVNWFVDTLKKHDKLPRETKVDATMFSLCSSSEVLSVLCLLVNADILAVWKVAPIFQKRAGSHVVISNPFMFGPCKITRGDGKHFENFYLNKKGVAMADVYTRNRNIKDIDAPYLLIRLINGQIALDRAKIRVKRLGDLVDSRVLCALVNSMVPDTFTTEVMLNDRWTMNLALDTASEIFQVTCAVDSHDLYQGDEEGMCAFLTYFIMSGFQFRQAHAVVQKVKELRQQMEDIEAELKAAANIPKKFEDLEKKYTSKSEELQWIESVYNCGECKDWVEHASRVQFKVRDKIAKKMTERFDVLTVPHPMTINELSESLVLDLSLTGGNGLFLSTVKEKLWSERRVVIFDKKSGEYYEDFSGRKHSKGSVRKILDVHDDGIVEISPTHYNDLEIYFESTSRNRILKGGTKFLYQIFPGTASQCERLLLRAAITDDKTTIRKLILFFKDDMEFVNCKDHETGNTALHLACRQGNTDVAVHFLENGAQINLQNNAGSTPFFLATEALHKQLSQILLEWGADIHIKNRISKKALELIRNEDLKQFLEEKYEEYQRVSQQLTRGDKDCLENLLKDHSSQKNPLASLRSRFINGETLFHTSALLGSEFGVELFLSKHIDTNLLSTSHRTPLHIARNPVILQCLIDHGADVNMADVDGNTVLHLLCSDGDTPSHHMAEAIRILVSNSAQLDISNNKGWLPIHCAAFHGLVSAMETMVSLDKDGSFNFLKEEETEISCPSLVHTSLLGHHLDCALWLSAHGFSIKQSHADEQLFKILADPPLQITDVVNTVKFLLEKGADPNVQYRSGDSPLHMLSPLLHLPELCQLLLAGGARVDPKNRERTTPLMNACKDNNLFLARILIENGADLHAVDCRGKRPFDYVEDHEDWIDSGHFSDDIRALLKAFSLRQARDLVHSIAKTVSTKNVASSRSGPTITR